MRSLIVHIAIFLFTCHAIAAKYEKSTEITGPGFYDQFRFDNITDPTHGRVTYVDEQTAKEHNLTYATDSTFILRADFTTDLLQSDPGRRSVRIMSKESYTTFTAIFDIRHMPEGCGTWPAVWTVGDNWPNEGEVDIVEGVNNMAPNTASLHTGTNCKMPSSRQMTGQSIGSNCAASETGNDGCGVQFREDPSNPITFGPGFNRAAGGLYAIERTNSYINVWFWSRHDGSVPRQVSSTSDTIDTSTWGTPAAAWSNQMCNITDHFGPHNIIINLTLCGDWAGNPTVYKNSGCPDTCEDFVNKNPASFYYAYFDIAAIRIYT